MGTIQNRKREFETWPKYKQMYIKAFDRMIADRNRGGMENPIKNGTDLMTAWQIGRFSPKALPKWGDDSTGEEVLNWWIK